MAFGRQTLGNLVDIAGSNFRLPEFGVSEAIAGGNTIFSNRQSSANNGQVLGTNTDSGQNSSQLNYTPAVGLDKTTVDKSPQTGSGATNVIQDSNSAIERYKQALDAARISGDELNSLFDPQLASINAAEQLTQQNRDAAFGNLDQQFGINRDQLESQVGQAQSELTAQEDSANKRALSSEAAARRLFTELNQANQQRFGGASSAGQAASELQGREFQRNTGDIRQALDETIQTIGLQKTKIQENYQNALKELTFNLDTAKQQVRQQFNDAILNLSQQRNMVESQKREARLSELQNYRDSIRQLNFQAIDFEQQLRQSAQSAVETLDQNLQQTLESRGYGEDAIVSQAEQSPLAYNTGVGVTDPGAINNAQSLTGQVDDELLNAQGIRTSQDDERVRPLTELRPEFVA